ncbi:MAG: helix-turn-helix domain-containing protein [Gammaproteobacteria bacterium]|nr:helix-turn-helix domain-containing protein [Gammaproteobacteria bacterium]MBU1443989.1 helix-turn-helix domain-containing protein [Gammaproteobacteria bacterium]MBU2286876.1 helix-turn-helix domain-containing protein [Gammaproteobacteria bacterium]MBU2410098.1 helix-turn-helix domain-containing protein [Gammaproteobacteria bacterium]
MKRVKPTSPPIDFMATDGKAFGASIRSARSTAGLTLSQAAMLLGIARQTLINLETAKSSVSLDTALRAAREFGVTILAVPGGQREPVRRAVSELMPRDAAQATPSPAR